MSSEQLNFYIDTPGMTGKPLPVKSYHISYDLFEASGTWEVEVDPNVTITDNFTRAAVRIELNDYPLMKGFIDRVEMECDKANWSQHYSGRDMCSVLIDNYILAYKPYLSGSVQSILADVWSKSNTITQVNWRGNADHAGEPIEQLSTPLSLPNLNFVYTSEAVNALSKGVVLTQGVRASPGQTLHEFFKDLLNQYGCYYYNQPGTNNIVIATIPLNGRSYNPDGTLDASPIADLDWDRVESFSRTRDYSGYYPFIRLLGQNDAQDIQENADSKDIQGNKIFRIPYKTEYLNLKTVNEYLAISDTSDPQVIIANNFQKFYVNEINVGSAAIWNNESQKLLSNKRMDQVRSLDNVKFTLHSHLIDGKPFFVNRVMTIIDMASTEKPNRLRLYGLYLLVHVELHGDRNEGKKTELEFCPVLN